MSRRARKRSRAATAGTTATPPPSRSELKNAEARAKLVPLREGERPRPVTVAAVVSLALVVANLALALAGFEVDGKRPALAGVLVFTALLLAMSVGLWRARYWAVLGFQALLAITMLIFALRLPFAANLTTVLISLAVLVPATALFWFLIKAMARIQMPERRVE